MARNSEKTTTTTTTLNVTNVMQLKVHLLVGNEEGKTKISQAYWLSSLGVRKTWIKSWFF